MAKMIALMHLSFDGFAAGPNGEMNWITMDQTIFEHVSKYISQVGTGVYGPKTFQMMEGYWPGVLTNPESKDLELQHARWYQNAKKVVCSHKTMPNLKEAMTKIKNESDKDLMVFGSPRLTQSLAKLELIDEFIINVNPVLLGSGVRMFEELPTTKLELISATKFDNGVVGFHYRRKS